MKNMLNRAWKRILAAMILIVALIVGGFTAASPALASGSLYNASYTLPIDVQTSTGAQYRIPAGYAWGHVDYVVVRAGQCVYVQWKGQFCPARGAVWVYVGNFASLYAQRSR